MWCVCLCVLFDLSVTGLMYNDETTIYIYIYIYVTPSN